MQSQVRMLEELGPDGMSSDEEVNTPQGKQYVVLVPRWRAPVLTPWLRVFDSLYLRHRNRAEHGDQRGSLPRRRNASARESTSQKFVPGLPVNAYRAEWLEQQLDIRNVIHPSPSRPYTHDPALAQCVCLSILLPTILISVVDWPWTFTAERRTLSHLHQPSCTARPSKNKNTTDGRSTCDMNIPSDCSCL